MSETTTSLIICAVLIGGVLAGAGLRRLLPVEHLDNHTKDIVRLGCGLIATIAGLEIRQLTANVILLDNLLERYGPEARPLRGQLRVATVAMIDRIWSEGVSKSGRNAPFAATTAGEAVHRAIRSLSPATEPQRVYHNQAIQAVSAILQARLILYEQSSGHIPVPFLAVLVSWLFILFVSFSLFSPLNPTALAAIVVIALAASGAFLLILAMYQPFTGFMQIDSGPLREALAPLPT